MHTTSKLYGIKNIQGAIENTIFVLEPYGPFCEDYFYHKTRGYIVHDHYLDQSKNDFNHFFLHVIISTSFNLR